MGAILQMCALYLAPHYFFTGILTTFLLVIAISYGFELFSLITKRGHYEILDAVAGIAGGIVGMTIILLFVCVI